LDSLEGGLYDDVWIRLVNDVTGDWNTSAVGYIGRGWCRRVASKSGAIYACSTEPGTNISINGCHSPNDKPSCSVLFPLWSGVAI